MTALLYTHPVCSEHSNFPGHPEKPDRLLAIERALDEPAFFMLLRREAPKAEIEDIERVHDRAYIDSIFSNIPNSGHRALDPDTGLSPATGEAALRAAGAACAAVDALVGGEARTAFCAIRPPGHHAERARAMGFCFFNNAAIAARRARVVHGLERVAVVDFDVHHGNGTQHDFWNDPTLFYASSHQWPAFPGTGLDEETRVGNIVNVTLEPGSGSGPFRRAYTERILPAVREFNPDLMIISAGFDGHARDPLAQLRLQTEDFEWVSRQIVQVADECCGGKTISVLEGGYDLPALGACMTAHMRVLMGN